MKHAILPFFLLVLVLILPACQPGSEPPAEPTEEQAAESGQSSQNLVQPSQWWDVHPRPVYATLEKVGTYQDWFDVYKLTEGTYAIYEPNQFEEAISYLFLGSERGALIDAGTGIGDMKAVVSELTDLPVFSLLTHEHYDHVGNAYRFDEIHAYDNAAGLQRLKDGRTNESLQRYLEDDYFWKPPPADFDPNAWTIPSIVPTKLYTEGDIIDFGGRTLEVIYTPGHSPGSMCLLDPDQKLLFTGDLFFPGPLYAYSSDVNLDDYMASIDKLTARIDEFDYLLSGHNDPWIKSDVLTRINPAFETIFSGGGEFSEAEGLRRYKFPDFDVLIRTEQIISQR
jgi:glyoxylase-like metal-dependent hydrolase (beta-lactamase superfamily II)